MRSESVSSIALSPMPRVERDGLSKTIPRRNDQYSSGISLNFQFSEESPLEPALSMENEADGASRRKPGEDARRRMLAEQSGLRSDRPA